ncbi:hypothetical protein CAEBREN_28810 [Caenorhabditis brenneri]|uniref:asparaginase n=1 Tax=Caenorhabditis brenneri TaxID=135651 RepID=G0MPB6_CAEBE|nr:hypothetical protein CAEBREN_28810 [Caenorhabditis brenneri]
MSIDGATCPPINIRRCSCTSEGFSPKKSITSPNFERRASKILDENHLPKQLLVQHHHEDGAFLRNISATELVLEVDETAHGAQQIGAPSALPESRVLVLYTGGTIGMKTTDGVYCPVPGYLPEVLRDIPPLNDRRYVEEIYSNTAVRPYSLPPVRNMKKRVVYWIVEYEPLLDSCDMTFDDWIRIATDFKKAYHKYDGFVGQVDVNYATGKILYDIGVIPGSDMTSEAAMAKLCYVLGKDEWDLPMKRSMLQANLRGEMTVATKGAMRELDIIPHIAKCLRVSSSQEVQLLRDIILPPMFCNAAKTNDVEILKSLKAAGVNFSATDYNLRTALHVAASNGNIESVNYLLKIGTNVHIKLVLDFELHSILKCFFRDMFGYNALVCAVKAKAMNCIIAIREAGGFIDASSQKIGVELCLAVYQNDIELLKCNEAAGIHMGEKDYDNRTALHVAVSLNKPEMVAYLLQCGLSPYEKDNFGITPIDEAKRRHLNTLIDMMEAAHQPESPESTSGVFHMD